MRAPRAILPLLCLSVLAALLPQAAVAAAPAWEVQAIPMPTTVAPSGNGRLLAIATNAGGETASSAASLGATLPTGLTPTQVTMRINDKAAASATCGISAQTVVCDAPGPLHPSLHLEMLVAFSASALAEGTVLPVPIEVQGGGAPSAVDTAQIRISSIPLSFGFLEGETGLRAPISEADGSPATAAGSHPYRQLVQMGFPTKIIGANAVAGAGTLRDAAADLPRGLIVNPAATPVLCTEAELTSESSPGCPEESQIGTATVITFAASPETATEPLYNMVPPPGTPASFGFDALGAGIFAHVIGELRSDGDFGLSGGSEDILARPLNPVFGVVLELWGDPTDPSHNAARGQCINSGGECHAKEPFPTALLTTPADCSGSPLTTLAHADSWEEPGLFHEKSYQSADLAGSPVSLGGCNEETFEPSLSVAPTTSLADSPSGLDVQLHQTTDQLLGHRSPAPLRDAAVTLPEGLVVNPSQAQGLDSCSEAQIGYLSESAGVHFSKQPAACPDASKLGTVTVSSPLVAEYEEEGTKLAIDLETGEGIPRPLHGSIYLAKPFDNPLGSLLAVYLTVEDPQTGTIAKLAGKVTPDPSTGQLTSTFEQNPQLPIEDIKLHLFGGDRGALITPPTCGQHTTTSTLTPWSAPEGADAHPGSSFQIAQQPGGGSCPASGGDAPHSPAFSAGTVTPKAGAHSPFVLKLSREDGSQRLAGIDTVLPPGLTGKLAGVGQCSEAQLAQAQARSHPEEGRLERESPSCPSSSQVGVVNVGAGAGPSPFYTQGHAYLAGPYKGAPLSLAVITPAIAGPFDLGTVVVRIALNLDPATAQIHAVSDPLPQILDGIPLDVRSVALTMDRPDFTLNPTSCDPMAITGSATSALGQTAALSQRFQVGDCSRLAFKPKLSLRLKGSVKRSSNPRLIATLTARPGEANIARAQVKLPKAVFLDQTHIGTSCTRVQFAADTCPGRSVYGKVSATTPLLDYPLTGLVYLRSSSHLLPDLVAKLEGPATQPIVIAVAGRTDAVKGALRNTFEAVPDAPISKFRLELFGGKRGLVEMSDGFCADRRATVKLDGQNGKTYDSRPTVRAECKAKGKRSKGKAAGGKGR